MILGIILFLFPNDVVLADENNVIDDNNEEIRHVIMNEEENDQLFELEMEIEELKFNLSEKRKQHIQILEELKTKHNLLHQALETPSLYEILGKKVEDDIHLQEVEIRGVVEELTTTTKSTKEKELSVLESILQGTPFYEETLTFNGDTNDIDDSDYVSPFVNIKTDSIKFNNVFSDDTFKKGMAMFIKTSESFRGTAGMGYVKSTSHAINNASKFARYIPVIRHVAKPLYYGTKGVDKGISIVEDPQKASNYVVEKKQSVTNTYEEKGVGMAVLKTAVIGTQIVVCDILLPAFVPFYGHFTKK
ncbi:Uncharacterized protein QTN25_000476 [Entamoeba marina]